MDNHPVTIARSELRTFFQAGHTATPCACRGNKPQWYRVWPRNDELGIYYLAHHLTKKGVDCEIRNAGLYAWGKCKELRKLTAPYLAEVKMLNEL